MARLTYGAKTLISQVEHHKPRSKASEVGDPDGLGVVRTIKFDKATSKWLAPLLDEIEDPRIETMHVTEAGHLHVTFVSTPKADSRLPFPLDAASFLAGK